MPRPNILVFMTDDHGQWASSAYGNREIRSPAMQWLAESGARMSRAFCPLPVCSPARASFFTGRIPSAHGIHDWLLETEEKTDHPGIAGQKTIAQFLHASGYRTGLAGKWHCGNFWTKQPGFDTWFTSAMGTNARFGKHAYLEDEERREFFGHQHQIVTERAVRFLREHAGGAAVEDHPFFLFVGYNNTHTPHAGEPEPVVSQYRHCRFADIPAETYRGEHGHARIAPFDRTDPTRHEQLAQYYAAVDVIDRQINRLVEELEALGMRDDTLIVYTSDHGHMNGHHGLHTKGNATIPSNFLDESILVPALIRWPGHVTPGAILDEPVDHCDLFATLLDAAGVDARDAAAEVNSPGRSFLPLLRGEAVPWRSHQICEHACSRMIRTENAKLIRRFPSKVSAWPDEFYDLRTDPRETRNVIDDPAHAEAIDEMDRILTAFFATYEDPEKAGINMATIAPHNHCDPWETLPGADDHRQ